MMTISHRRFPAAMLGLVAVLALSGSPALAQDAKPADKTVVARIDGLEITEQEITIASEDLGERIAQVPEAQRRDYVIGFLADLKVGARAAEQAKVMDAPDFAARLAYFRQKVLMDEYISRGSKAAATPEAARKLFDDTVSTMKPDEEVRARHILLEKEDEAKAVLERIRKGEDFAKIATELSKDPGSGAQGGDLGFFTKDRMVPQFAEKAFVLKAGEVSEPVQTQFGWHIIKVEERRSRPLPKFEDVRNEIETYLVRKAQQDLVVSLRGALKLERLDQPKP